MGTPTREERSFSCLDTRERTKEKVKAGEKMAENFSAELKRIKYVSSLRHTGDEYSFLNAPLRNFLNAIFSQADPNYDMKKNSLSVRGSFYRDTYQLGNLMIDEGGVESPLIGLHCSNVDGRIMSAAERWLI